MANGAAGVLDLIQKGHENGQFYRKKNAKIANIFAGVVKYDTVKHFSVIASNLKSIEMAERKLP